MNKGVNIVAKWKMGYKLAAKAYYVPQTTPKIEVEEARVIVDPTASATSVQVPLGSKKNIFR